MGEIQLSTFEVSPSFSFFLPTCCHNEHSLSPPKMLLPPPSSPCPFVAFVAAMNSQIQHLTVCTFKLSTSEFSFHFAATMNIQQSEATMKQSEAISACLIAIEGFYSQLIICLYTETSDLSLFPAKIYVSSVEKLASRACGHQ